MFRLYSILIILALLTCAFCFYEADSYHISSFHESKYSSGPPAGRTGAPGEANCTVCHTGSVLDGNSINTLVVTLGNDTVDTYLPNTTYIVKSNMPLSTVRKGFQATVLDASNTFAGTINALSNTAQVSSSGRTYAQHTGASNSGSLQFWEWEWQSPASDIGPVTFYMACNKSNGNNTPLGDEIYLSQHNLGSLLGTKEISKSKSLKIYGNIHDGISYSFSSELHGPMEMQLLNAAGRKVWFQSGIAQPGDNKGKILFKKEINAGLYYLHLVIGNNAFSEKIYLN